MFPAMISDKNSVKISKRLNLFLNGLYGGGPTVVQNKSFFEKEKKYMQ